MIKSARFIFNSFGENTYVIWDQTAEAIIVDAGCVSEAEKQTLADFVAQNGLKPVMAVCTHAHPDHVAGVEWVKSHYNIPLAFHSADLPLLGQMASYGAMFGFNIGGIAPDIDLAEQKNIAFGDTVAEVIHTPGHSQGGVCLYFDKAGVVVSGDTLFAGSIGRTDLPGGDYDSLMDSIVNKLLPLGGGVRVLCGHGGETTIAQEAGSNPFITEVINGGFNKPYQE